MKGSSANQKAEQITSEATERGRKSEEEVLTKVVAEAKQEARWEAARIVAEAKQRAEQQNKHQYQPEPDGTGYSLRSKR